MAKKKNIKKKAKPQWKEALGYSPAQATASGAGVHEKRGVYRRRDERRKAKQNLKTEDRDNL